MATATLVMAVGPTKTQASLCTACRVALKRQGTKLVKIRASRYFPCSRCTDTTPGEFDRHYAPAPKTKRRKKTKARTRK